MTPSEEDKINDTTEYYKYARKCFGAGNIPAKFSEWYKSR